MRKWGIVLNILSSFILMGVGFYFAFFRPAFLPEDIAFIGASQGLEGLFPRLAIWLDRVFLVLGGFIFSTGALVAGVSFSARRKKIDRPSKAVLFVAWGSSLGLMSGVNFSIHSDFRWLIFAQAVLWISGILLLN